MPQAGPMLSFLYLRARNCMRAGYRSVLQVVRFVGFVSRADSWCHLRSLTKSIVWTYENLAPVTLVMWFVFLRGRHLWTPLKLPVVLPLGRALTLYFFFTSGNTLFSELAKALRVAPGVRISPGSPTPRGGDQWNNQVLYFASPGRRLNFFWLSDCAKTQPGNQKRRLDSPRRIPPAHAKVFFFWKIYLVFEGG